MTFLRNCWYAAAWDNEVSADGLFHRRILNEDVLLVRGADSQVHALRNRCPHRFAPLSMGQRSGDVIECPYHGLRFNLSGQCVLNPHGHGRIPPNTQAKSYPIIERHMLIWIWMGEPEKADSTLIPELTGLDVDRFDVVRGYMYTPANYEYVTDNIMDLGHIEYLHKGILGSEAINRSEVDVKQDGNTVYSRRLAKNEILPAGLEPTYQSGGELCDRWLDVTWHPPANMQLVVGVTKAGAPERIGKESHGVHLMTPETEISTHYFWSNARDFRRHDEELNARTYEGLLYAFEQQDKPMIIAQHEAIGGEDFWDLRPVILEGDAGAVRARRILRKLIRDEGNVN